MNRYVRLPRKEALPPPARMSANSQKRTLAARGITAIVASHIFDWLRAARGYSYTLGITAPAQTVVSQSSRADRHASEKCFSLTLELFRLAIARRTPYWRTTARDETDGAVAQRSIRV